MSLHNRIIPKSLNPYLEYFLILISTTSVLSHLPSDHSDPLNGKLPTWNLTYTDLLKRDLLAHYDKYARPAHVNNITSIDVDMTFIHIDVDDVKSLVTVNGWVKMMWNDEKLKWNKSDYGGISKLHVGDHEVWIPDIVLYNNARGNNIDHYGNTYAIVYPEGNVLWVPPCQFDLFCEMDLSKWPFDRHNCILKLGSWTHGGDMIDITTNLTKPVDVQMVVTWSSWKVVSIKKTRNIKYYPCCEEPYADILFEISLERESSSYYVVIFLPAIAVMLLSLSVFWIPSNSGSKFMVAATNGLIITMFLLYLSQRLAVLGPATPIIVLYYTYSLILVAISMIVSIISYNMATKRNSKPAPSALTNIINSKMSALLMLPKHKSWSSNERGGEELTERSNLDEDREDLTSAAAQSKRPAVPEWFVVATAVDRIAFFTYCVLYLIFVIRFIH